MTSCTGNFTSPIHICKFILTTIYYCSNSAGLNKTVTRELLKVNSAEFTTYYRRSPLSANFFYVDGVPQFMAVNATGQLKPNRTALLVLGDI